MLQKFQQYCRDNALFEGKDKILLAVSGGVDSMVMFDLFLKSGVNMGVAHCNFQLREVDSIEDESFVTETTNKHKIPLHSIRFNTNEYAVGKGISIQMAARELRYNWFESLRKTFNYQFIATAHHSDDVLEGFFLNLLRKTGISGLHGIRPKLNCLIRPLLFASKADIMQYSSENNIVYKEDRTNADVHYQRNYIRHHIIPAFKELKSNFADSLLDSIAIISKQEAVYKNHVLQTAGSIAEKTAEGIEIAISNLKKLPYPDIYLFEMLYPFDYNESQVEDIMQSLDNKEEKIFHSDTHQLLKTRSQLIVKRIENSQKNEIFVVETDLKPASTNPTHQHGIQLKILPYSNDFVFENSKNTAYFDFDKLAFPLLSRSWKHGDIFSPFGGKGKKKISDLFTDAKLSSIEKEKTRLLCNQNGDIIWAVGLRSDNRYRVTTQTKNILKCVATSQIH